MADVSIDPSIVYFTFSRIRPKFSCGRTVEDTLRELIEGRLDLQTLPRITLLHDGRNYFSLNNRRLYVFKRLREAGVISTVPARVKAVPASKRMQSKYSADTCSLEARLMGSSSSRACGDRGEERNSDEEDITSCNEQQDANAIATNELVTENQMSGTQHLLSAAPQKVPSKQTAAKPAKAPEAAAVPRRLQRGATLEEELSALLSGSLDDDETEPRKSTSRRRGKK